MMKRTNMILSQHFPGQTIDFHLKHVKHIWKVYASAVNLSYLETILVHLMRRQSFTDKLHSTVHNQSETLSYAIYITC